jgi:hypothetical protein
MSHVIHRGSGQWWHWSLLAFRSDRYDEGTHHAAVTVSAHHLVMRNAPDHPEPGRVGVLILRVWLEATADDAQLRIRMVGRYDVSREVEDTASASTIEDALARIRDWLEQFSSSAPGSSGCRRGSDATDSAP